MDQSFVNLLIALAFCCVIPVIIVIALSAWIVWRGTRLLNVDEAALRKEFDALRARTPNTTTPELVERIIRRQAVRSGIVGAVTSIGGLPFLPIGLPIDMVLSNRLQVETLHFLAYAHSTSGVQLPVLNQRVALVLNDQRMVALAMRGQELAAGVAGRFTAALLRRLTVMVGGKAFAKLIPFVGMGLGFAVNYAIARGFARLANGWYSGEFARRAASLTARPR